MAKLDLKGKSVEELNEELEQTQRHYNDLQFNNAVSSLDNTAELRTVRRNIARIKTAIRAHELEGSTEQRDRIRARRRRAKKISK